MTDTIPKRKPKRAARPVRPTRKPSRENPFAQLGELEALQERLGRRFRRDDARMQRLERDMRRRRHPGVVRPRKEFNI